MALECEACEQLNQWTFETVSMLSFVLVIQSRDARIVDSHAIVFISCIGCYSTNSYDFYLWYRHGRRSTGCQYGKESCEDHGQGTRSLPHLCMLVLNRFNAIYLPISYVVHPVRAVHRAQYDEHEGWGVRCRVRPAGPVCRKEFQIIISRFVSCLFWF